MATKPKPKAKNVKTQSRTAKSKISSKRKFPLWAIIALVAVIAGVGLYLVYNSFASGNPGQLQPVPATVYCYEGSCSFGDNGGNAVNTLVTLAQRDAFNKVCGTGYAYKSPSKNKYFCMDDASVGLAKLVWHWQPVADCESTDNIYARNGSFMGWLQFDQATWTGNGGSGSPYGQSREYTARIAKNLKESRGLQPWPICGRRYR